MKIVEDSMIGLTGLISAFNAWFINVTLSTDYVAKYENIVNKTITVLGNIYLKSTQNS